MRPFLMAAGFLFAAFPAVAKAPEVVATVKPVHALVAQVMQGVGTPRLLLDGNASPHAYSLKPSDARALADAAVIFMVGGELETFLEKPLATLSREVEVVSMAEAPGVERLPLREGGLWEGHEHEHGHEDKHEDEHQEEEFDNHLWLDPRNAKAFVAAAAAALAAADPANAETYQANAAAARNALDELDAELAAALAPVAGTPYLVFHDAYHYLEDRYGLTPAGAVTIGPERQPGARRVAEIEARIKEGDVRCVFREPQFSPKLLDAIARGTGVRTGVLDPLGSGIAAGPEAYAETMRALAASLRDCLGG